MNSDELDKHQRDLEGLKDELDKVPHGVFSFSIGKRQSRIGILIMMGSCESELNTANWNNNIS